MDEFQFEAETAVIPVFGSRWQACAEDARVYYQNAKSLELYGDWRGQFLVDVFSEVIRLSRFETEEYGRVLMRNLVENRRLKAVSGTLAGKRVELYSCIQEYAKKSIQTTIVDVTNRFVDALSGIPGRDLFFDRLNGELFRAVREKSELHICFVDLDGFKQTNDLFGHKAGDDVIVEVGRRLQAMVRRHEVVSRFGGDEFVVMLSAPHVDSVFFAERKLIPLLNEPYLAAGHQVSFIGASVGIASAPVHSSNADELVSFADDAMYAAKDRGKNRAVVFEPSMLGMKKH